MSTILPTVTPPQTLEQRVTTLEAKAEAWLKTAEVDVQTTAQKWWTWIKANIVHIAGYASVVAAVKKFI